MALGHCGKVKQRWIRRIQQAGAPRHQRQGNFEQEYEHRSAGTRRRRMPREAAPWSWATSNVAAPYRPIAPKHPQPTHSQTAGAQEELAISAPPTFTSPPPQCEVN